MYSLRKAVMISGGLFALILVMGWGGTALQASGVLKHPERLQAPMKIIFFTIFIAFAFSLIPTMVKLFLAGQTSIGNADKRLIMLVDRHQVALIWTIWGLWIAGLAVALPTIIRVGFFSDSGGAGSAGASRDDELARQIAATPVQGLLVAAPGMTIDEMIRGSTLKIKREATSAGPGESVYASGAIFNFRVAGTGIEFPRCRYYFVNTYTDDTAHIEAINIGTASARMTRAQLDAANAALRSRLKADGWLTGHEVYRDALDRQLHGGRTRGVEGKLWLKNDITLDIEERRLDDPRPGEDTATAGEWIQYIDLRTRKDYPWIDRYEFAPAK
jgi:hypothetical protein